MCCFKDLGDSEVRIQRGRKENKQRFQDVEDYQFDERNKKEKDW